MDKKIAQEILQHDQSGFKTLVGMEITELNSDHAVLELTMEPKHMNSQGGLHGGVLATLVDNAGGVAGCYCTRTKTHRNAVTLSLTTSFLAPAKPGKIRAVSRKRSSGRKIFTSSTEIFDECGTLLAIGESTYRYVTEPKERDLPDCGAAERR